MIHFKMPYVRGFIPFMLFAAISILNASTYYVDVGHPSASDSNPGTMGLPWATIQHAADEVAAGDTVFIREGTYNENVYIGTSGTPPDDYIIFRAYPGESPVLDGTGVEAENGLVVGSSYLKLIGLEVCNWYGNGMWFESGGFTEIWDCEVHDVMYGIGFAYGAHDFTLNNVLMHHFDLYGFDASPSGGDPCYNGTLNDCIAHTGRSPGENVDGFAFGHGDQHDYVLNNCTAYGVFDGFDISARNTTLNACLAYDCDNGCYKLWQEEVRLVNCIGYDASGSITEIDWDGDPGTTYLTNCTFFDSETYVLWIENPGDEVYMYNCILAGGDNICLAFELMGTSNYHGDYNIFHTDDGSRAVAVGYTDEFSLTEVEAGDWTAYSGQDAHSLVVFDLDTLFINPSVYDLHLPSWSPAVDRGAAGGAPTVDFEGNPRPVGAGYDIGAYEYTPGGAINEGLLKPENFEIIAYPNPFNCAISIEISGVGTDYNLSLQNQIKIFDITGKMVENLTPLCSLYPAPCSLLLSWSPEAVIPSGVYFINVVMGENSLANKVVYLK
ncbi:right-handed parallel beta-helix repeat-containing protein [bacterium]|nr:right-handed parallel beta-helix repeat-containing protein [bacterium]